MQAKVGNHWFKKTTQPVFVNVRDGNCEHQLSTHVIVKLDLKLTAILAFPPPCQTQVQMTSLHCDCKAKVKSSLFCFPTPLLMLSVWIKAVCVLKVSGFPGSVADAASQISLVHTSYKQAWPRLGRGVRKITVFYPRLSLSVSQQTDSLLSDIVITFSKKGALFSLLRITYKTNEMQEKNSSFYTDSD